MQRLTLLVTALMVSILPAQAGDGQDEASYSRNPVITFVRKVGTLLDSMAVNGLDRRYLGVPSKPWQIILRGNMNQSDLKLSSSTHNAEEMFFFMQDEMTWEPRIKTIPATYTGFWAGYRGYGVGFSWNVGGDKGRILTVGATGGSYGVNMRIHWFDNDNPEVKFRGNVLSDITEELDIIYTPISFNEEMDLGSPIKTRALFLDGYYLFNGKRCSYAAAYDQSAIQKRSAGSLVAGAMYFHSTTKYDTDINADLILFMNDIGRIKTWQASAGAGYIYNWVPAKGLLVSGMAIPMLTFYNHNKLWRYDSNFKDALAERGFSDVLDMEETTYRIREASQNAVSTYNSNMGVNIDARMSVTYEWNNFLYFNAFGQFSNFKYKMDHITGHLNDWYVNASIGIRL
jgi:hypothetical protein